MKKTKIKSLLSLKSSIALAYILTKQYSPRQCFLSAKHMDLSVAQRNEMNKKEEDLLNKINKLDELKKIIEDN